VYFIRILKTDFGRERYISQLPDVHIFPLIKFRCCNHKLQIELGRREGLCREDRICKSCDLGLIGDEFHFIFECPNYSLNRKSLIPYRFRSNQSVFSFCNLFQSGKKVQLNLSKFIKFSKIV